MAERVVGEKGKRFKYTRRKSGRKFYLLDLPRSFVVWILSFLPVWETCALQATSVDMQRYKNVSYNHPFSTLCNKKRQKNKSHFLWCLRCCEKCLDETVQLEGSGVSFTSVKWKWYSILKACRNVNTIVTWPLEYLV